MIVELRDWFAAQCPEEELPKFTVGDVRERFNLDRSEYGSAAQWRQMRCEARYAYADAMLAVRKSKTV